VVLGVLCGRSLRSLRSKIFPRLDDTQLSPNEKGDLKSRLQKPFIGVNRPLPHRFLHFGNPVRTFQHLTRFRTIRRTHDSIPLHQVDQVRRPPVSDAQPSLQQGSGSLSKLDHQPHRIVVEGIVLQFAVGPSPPASPASRSSRGACRKSSTYCAAACDRQNSTTVASSFSVTSGACRRCTRADPEGK